MRERPITPKPSAVRAILREGDPKRVLRMPIDPGPPPIRLPRTVSSDIPFNLIHPPRFAPPGVYQPTSNRYGALCVQATNREKLGVKPDEFEWVHPFGEEMVDRLWVRCPWHHYTPPPTNPNNEQAWDEWTNTVRWPTGEVILDCCPNVNSPGWLPRAADEMPRWASWITLGLIAVRAEVAEFDFIDDGIAKGQWCWVVCFNVVTP